MAWARSLAHWVDVRQVDASIHLPPYLKEILGSLVVDFIENPLKKTRALWFYKLFFESQRMMTASPRAMVENRVFHSGRLLDQIVPSFFPIDRL